MGHGESGFLDPSERRLPGRKKLGVEYLRSLFPYHFGPRAHSGRGAKRRSHAELDQFSMTHTLTHVSRTIKGHVRNLPFYSVIDVS